MTAKKPPGATLHLGGDAYAHPHLEPFLVPIHTVKPYPGNPRRGDQTAITSSIRDHGLYTGVVTQARTHRILVGNHRRHALIELGAERIPEQPIRVDDTRAAAIVARDNLTSDLGTYDDQELLALLQPLADADQLALSGYDAADLAALSSLADQMGGPEYTRKADPIHYQPTAETPPAPGELLDRGKANELVRQVTDADVPTEVRDFLIAAAQRHLVFNYAQIAEFYAHATPEVQALMEASALVIVDYEDAIQHGFVRLSGRLTDLRDQDRMERDAQDAAGVAYGA